MDDGTGSLSGSYTYENSQNETITVNFSEIENLIGFPAYPDGVVDGTTGADVIDAAYTGDPEGDMVDGADGLDDVIDAGAGNDTVFSGDGNDTVDGGTGDEYIDGGAGDDSLFGGDGSDQISGGTGADVLDGGNGDDDLIMGSGDTAYGGAGDDQFWAYDYEGIGGTATVIGGETGEDLTDPTNGGNGDSLELWWDGAGYLADDQTVTMTGDEAGTVTGSDTDIVFSEIENIVLGTGNDTVDLSADTSGMTVNTNSGDDSVIGGTGADSILGGGGDDTIALNDGFGNDTIVGGETDEINGDTLDASGVTAPLDVTFTGNEAGTVTDGTDTATFSEIEAVVLGGGADNVDATAATSPVDVDGGAGDDTLAGSTGADTLSGGDGADVIDGGAGDDAISGGNDNDSLTGGAGNDTLLGDAGNDTLDGGEGADLLDGGANDDDITAGAGDTVLGGDGDDVITIDPSLTGTGTITVTGGEGAEEDAIDPTNNPGGQIGDVLDLSNLSDVAVTYDQTDPTWDGTTSESGTATFTNDAGETVSIGFSEIENVILPSNGVVDGTTGADVIDTAYTGDPEGDMVDGADGLDDVIDAGAGNDTVFSGDGNDTVDGGTGDEYIDGGAGDDSLFGGDGSDQISGGTGADVLDGGNGDDDLIMGSGDTAYGGAGDDQFWAYDYEGIGGTATVIGGETGEDLTDPTNGGNGDSLELWWDGAGYLADDQTVTMTGDEAGTVTGSDTDIVFSEIENIVLGTGNDTVDLSADTSGMTVNTNSGDDSVIGGTGDDTISGGSGDDTISGGTGDDVLTGGLGNDDFVYAAGDGADTITDFGDQTGTANDGDPTNNDHLDLSSFYNQTNYDAAVANGEIDPSVIKNPLQWMRADLDDDGVLNGSQGDAGFVPGDSLTLTGVTAADLTTETTNVICFARGSRIATAGGEVPVEHLSVGDRVITRDNGFQTIRWIGSARRKAVGRLAPIMIREGVLDNHRDLFVSPNHRMLIRSGVSELLTGESEVLVSAKLLVDGEGIVRVEGGEVEYFHILFDNHEIILSEGSWTESFHPGRFGMSTLCESARQEVLDLFPELGGNLEDAVTARLVLNAKEAALVAYGV